MRRIPVPSHMARDDLGEMPDEAGQKTVAIDIRSDLRFEVHTSTQPLHTRWFLVRHGDRYSDPRRTPRTYKEHFTIPLVANVYLGMRHATGRRRSLTNPAPPPGW